MASDPVASEHRLPIPSGRRDILIVKTAHSSSVLQEMFVARKRVKAVIDIASLTTAVLVGVVCVLFELQDGEAGKQGPAGAMEALVRYIANGGGVLFTHDWLDYVFMRVSCASTDAQCFHDDAYTFMIIRGISNTGFLPL